jgi:signal transduction histidine kinase
MTSPYRQWLREHLELLALGVSTVLSAAIMLWWAIFMHAKIDQIASLERSLIAAQGRTDTVLMTERYAQIDERNRGWKLMLVSETLVLGMLLTTSLVGLYALALRRRRQRERMEQLLQVTSHEFKTPIAGVKALLQSLALGTIPAAKRAELTQLALDECERLEHLAETMLAFQRAVAGGVSQRLTAPTIVTEVLAHRRATRIPETIVCEQLEPVWVLADPDAMRVILENLLDNARKYGGGATTIGARIEADAWCLEVADRGAGFDPQLTDVLFDTYRRDARHASAHGGGLGLAISRQLARRMGGELSATSRGIDQGAVFTLRLPLAAAAPQGLAPQPLQRHV